MDFWLQFDTKTIDYEKRVFANLLQLLSPRLNLFIFNPNLHQHFHQLQETIAEPYEVSSIRQCKQTYHMLDNELQELSYECSREFPEAMQHDLQRLSEQQHMRQAFPLFFSQWIARYKPPDTVLTWPRIQALLQSKSMQLNEWSRVPLNLLRSAQEILQRLSEVYSELWTKKQRLIQFVNQHFTQTNKASVQLFRDQLLSQLVPRFHSTLLETRKQLSLDHQQYQAQVSQLKNLLEQTRAVYLKHWKEQERPQWIKVMEALKLESDVDEAQSPEESQSAQEYDNLYNEWTLLEQEMELQTQKPQVGSFEPLFSILMKRWLNLIDSVMRWTRDRVNDSFNSINSYNSSKGVSHQLQTSSSLLQRAHVMQAKQLEYEYQNLKTVYETLAKRTIQEKQKQAQLLLQPGQVKSLIASDKSSTGLDHVIESRDVIEDLDQKGRDTVLKIKRICLPSLQAHRECASKWQAAQKWVSQLPVLTQSWINRVRDEARILDPLDALQSDFSRTYVLQSQTCQHELELKLRSSQQVHEAGNQYVKQHHLTLLKQTLDQWKQLDDSVKPVVARMWQLLSHVKKSLADQRTEIANHCSQELLLEQSEFTRMIDDMRAYQEESLNAALWLSSQMRLEYVAELLQIIKVDHPSSADKNSFVNLLLFYDKGLQNPI